MRPFLTWGQERRYYRRHRGIAQSGSAPALGAGCREFESLYPDQLSSHSLVSSVIHSGIAMVAVAHQVEHRIVAPEVGGSRPLGHPIFPQSLIIVLSGGGDRATVKSTRP